MRKPSKPWYRAYNDTWYVCLNGQQVALAKGKNNKTEAERAFYRIMAEGTPQALRPSETRVVAVFDLFLDHSQKHNAPRTYAWYHEFLQDFSNLFGTLRIEELKPFHVTRWLDSHADWDGCRWGAITAVKRALNWAVDEGLIRENPIKKIKKPAMRVRERFLTTEERKEIFDNYRQGDCFCDFLFAMEQTGCRPGEVATITAKQADLQQAVWTMDDHKTASKTGQARVIILTPAMVELTTRLLKRFPTGPLFRNEDGNPWSGNAIRCRFRRVREKLKLGDDVVAYLYRHAVATDLLEAGVGVAQTAEILGHKGTEMVMRHYQKLRNRREHLREQILKARPQAKPDA